MVSKVKTILTVGLALAVAFALIAAPLIIVQDVHASYFVPYTYLAPDFSMTDLNGNTFSLSSFIAGKVALLEFFKTTCPYCQSETGELETILSNYGSKITMLAVSLDPADWSSGNNSTFVSFISTYGVTYKIAEDTYGGVNDIGSAIYNAIALAACGCGGAIPQIFIINRTGYIKFANVATAILPPLPAATLMGEIDSSLLDLNVTSAHDSPSPGVGDSFYDSGSSVTCNVTSPVVEGGAPWSCTGWTGTGSVPSSGSSTSTTFTITQNSKITWNWVHTFLNVTADTAYAMWTNGSFPDLVFLDVRDYTESYSGSYNSLAAGYSQSHIYGTIWIPWGTGNLETFNLTGRIGELAGLENTPILVYCKSGGRSVQAAAFLVSNKYDNFTKVYHLYDLTKSPKGGLGLWISAGYPVVTSRLYAVHVGVTNNMFWGSVDLNTTSPNPTFLGWNTIPGMTTLSVATTVSNGILYMVHVGVNNDMFWGSVNLASSTFSGWTILPGKTNLTPTIAASNGKLYIVHVGYTSNMFWGSVDLNTKSFSGWTMLPGMTNLSVSASISNGKLYIVHVGYTSNMFWGSVDLNTKSFSGWNILPGMTSLSASVAAYDGELYLAHVGYTSNMFWGRLNLTDSSFIGWNLLPGMTTKSVSIAYWGELYIMHVGYTSSMFWGGVDPSSSSFSGWAILPGTTSLSAATTAVDPTS